MTSYTLFTDPHLGTRRAAHTTRESSKRLTLHLYAQALGIVESYPHPICLGDLFDRAFNDEATLVQGYAVASRCLFTLAGNHDEVNREGAVTTLRALQALNVPLSAGPDLSSPFFTANDDGLYSVPHHASQELFEQALLQAAQHAAENRAGKFAALLLHCNYNVPFKTEDDTLNLTPELAEQLLADFDLILLGHEHRPAAYFDGRVVVMGNTHPTSFADISDKFAYHLDAETGELSRELIWSQASGYREIKVGEEIGDLAGVQFVDVVGLAGAEDAVAVAEFVQQVWAAAPEAYAVRNNVQIGDHLADVEEAERPALVDLKSKISADLEGSDLLPLYEQLVKEVEA